MQDYSNWMFENLSTLGGAKISELTLPASHDSGMYSLTQSTCFSNSCNTKTQELGIYEQLKAGVRYFDLRPVISNGLFYTGHYSKPKIVGTKVLLGSCGVSISDFAGLVRDFAQSHRELVIVNISHAYNTDEGGKEFSPYEWSGMLNKLIGGLGPFVVRGADPAVGCLGDRTLSELLLHKDCSAVQLYIPDDAPINIGANARGGLYPASRLNICGKYSDTIDVDKLYADQTRKMLEFDRNDGSTLFRLDWTLTMQFQQTLACWAHPGEALSIQGYARKAKGMLVDAIGLMNKDVYPNLISMDFVDSDLTEQCVDLNLARHGTK